MEWGKRGGQRIKCEERLRNETLEREKRRIQSKKKGKVIYGNLLPKEYHMWAKKVRGTWRGKLRGVRMAVEYFFDYHQFHFLVWWTSWWVTGCVCLLKETRAVAGVASLLHHQKNMANWQISEIFSNFPLLFFLRILLIRISLQELNSGFQLVSHLMQELTSWCSHIKLFYD